ncbi:SDR family oxidoreductase [Teichococcus oryzae]|uniref:SDR family oxidoreductase n=1 Tax=Teichococcus oryzae TaxID=1608942 RepID=A0A5B2TCQ1_9PROT|nr:SDR family oxidoreductase [Pseudoroseomonas oryzae]KAA2212286.1 SDR family oxidoreductase [Pseudoroseomonas oryzae]
MESQIPLSVPRTALVTGASRRLGRAIALELAAAGFDLALHHGHSAAEAEIVAEEVRQLGRRAAVLQADLEQEAETGCLVPEAISALGSVGVLVNNAATFRRDEWHDASRASWDHHLEPNLRAPFVLTQAMAQALPPDAQGVVINMLDQRVWSLTPHFVSYSVSKAGLWALTQSLALALAPRIRVNGIGPGPALPSPGQTASQFAAQAASTPLGRGTSPEEVARAVMAILSLPAMTGQMIALDGGQHLQWSPQRRQEAP